jgi:hypothetical protein
MSMCARQNLGDVRGKDASGRDNPSVQGLADVELLLNNLSGVEIIQDTIFASPGLPGRSISVR